MSKSILAAFILAAAGNSHAAPWLYQLQNPNPDKIAISGFKVAVIDYSRDGTDRTRIKPKKLTKLWRSGVTALSYFSIGEAENYRFYWNAAWVSTANTNQFTAAAPAWLGRMNRDWPGNYKVRYWDTSWRESVLRPYLDKILAQGFKGIYLDIIDAFEYWASPASYGGAGEVYRAGDPMGDETEAARRMIELVEWLANYARGNGSPTFLVFPQNGERILSYDRDGRYKRVISGIGVEDLYYDGTRRKPKRETKSRLRFLKLLQLAGKKVFCVDYVDTGRPDTRNRARIDDFVNRCKAQGFDFYVGREDRALSRINTISGVQP